ncbi:DUF4097 family beta strand repeat protein [Rossellomorea vietnamensis]|uniref:DUF4097 family beta strand repeat protein n=1 Tax=Rossellomorea vietnamensis TaxID=218284 RepID=A0A5D4MB25_9BACI|nr:DUF4097 family beta strand repeat-containing protein [Rossellomorea vietnamensis]TYR98836.1 DUF4097 family beta strand repeat protein [Rossellomorea vietnamensis]
MNEERKRILDMVEKGQLSTKEALTLLEALDKEGSSHKEKQPYKEKETDLLDDLANLFTGEKKDYKDDYGEKTTYTNNNGKDKLIDFFQSALNKVKNFDLDFEFNKSIELSHVFQETEVGALKEAAVDVANGKVEVLPWEQDEVRVECQVKVYRTDDIEEARRSFLANTDFYIENGKVRLSTELKWMKVNTKVYIPASQYEKVSIKVLNGTVSSERVKADSFKVRSANGKVELKDMVTKHIEVDTSNGAIHLANIISDSVEAESINGKVYLEGDVAETDLQSLNGTIVCCLRGDRADTLHAKAVTGGIDLYVPENIGIKGEAKSNLGSFKIEMEGINIVEEKNEVVQKHVHFSKESDSDKKLHIFAHTKTGSVVIKKSEVKNDM